MRKLFTEDTDSCQEISSISIETARRKSEKQEIYQFRYQVYVTEMAKPIIGKHSQDMINDALDDSSLLLYARDNTGIIGTLRLTFGESKDFPVDLADIFDMKKAETTLRQHYTSVKFCLSTKLAIKKNYRSSQLLYMFIVEAYKHFRKNNVQFNFSGCNPYLIPMYEQMGFRRFTHNFVDPGYGLLVPIIMVIEDLEHFHAVRSPFYRLARGLNNDPNIGNLFISTFPQTLSHVNSQLISKEDLWQIITHKLKASPLAAIPLLNGLEEKAASAFLHFGVIIQVNPHDCIVNPGDASNELYILLSGYVQGETFHETRIIYPGQSFGNTGMVMPEVQVEKITAVTFSEVLVIAKQYFPKFKRLYPAAYFKVLRKFNSSLAYKGEMTHE
jgi:predicted GNAT family N-acyltransferase